MAVKLTPKKESVAEKVQKTVTTPVAPVQQPKQVLNPDRLRRTSVLPTKRQPPKKEPTAVTMGPVDRIVDVAVNASRSKIKEITVVDMIQGRLLPILDALNVEWDYTIQIAMFRQNKTAYLELYPDNTEGPVPPDTIDNYIYGIAQWQKSVKGRGLDQLVDLTKAQMESTGGDEGDGVGGGDAWKD